MEDTPRSLRSREEIDRRRAALGGVHIAPLARFAASLRQRGYGEVPDFDPFDGGVNARILFLYEKPGPMANSSGFISRNNDDLTAAYTFEFMARANLPRKQTCLWNVIPGWNGKILIAGTEHADGVKALDGLAKIAARAACRCARRQESAASATVGQRRRIGDHRISTPVAEGPSDGAGKVGRDTRAMGTCAGIPPIARRLLPGPTSPTHVGATKSSRYCRNPKPTPDRSRREGGARLDRNRRSSDAGPPASHW